MDNLQRIFYTASESIGVLCNEELEYNLSKLGASNIKKLPKWVWLEMGHPVPVVQGANVERLNFIIPGASLAYIDIHEIEDITIYIKIFIIFGIHKLLKHIKYNKVINDMMHKNYGTPNMETTISIKPYIGDGCLVYTGNRDHMVITNVSSTILLKEFQIHLYDNIFFISSTIGSVL